MRTATVHELKQELQAQDEKTLVTLCLRLARFKKENKELLTYLLFEAHNEQAYIIGVKELVDQAYTELPRESAYFTKKGLRKILRLTNKYIRYAGSKQAETELLLHFCKAMKENGLLEKRSGIKVLFKKTDAITNIFQQQLKKIHSALTQLHEDLQYDYQKELEALG